MKLSPNSITVPAPLATTNPATTKSKHAQPEDQHALLAPREDAEHEQRHGAACQDQLGQRDGEVEGLEHGQSSYGASASRA